MALPDNIVPKLLIPFFQSGVMRQLIDIAENSGTGLNLFNAIRKAWPRDPSLPADVYNQLVGWISRFTGRSMKAGQYLNGLENNLPIDTSVIPKNFYLRRPNSTMCNWYVQASYYTMDSERGTFYENQAAYFIDEQQTKAGVLDAISERIQSDLENIAGTNRRDKTYLIVRPSINLNSIVRLC